MSFVLISLARAKPLVGTAYNGQQYDLLMDLSVYQVYNEMMKGL
jgi:hypothetical protein